MIKFQNKTKIIIRVVLKKKEKKKNKSQILKTSNFY